MLLTATPLLSKAHVVALDKGATIADNRGGWLPYVFSTDSLGFTIGIGGGFSGNFQPQSSVFTSFFISSNESTLATGSIDNIRLGNSSFFADSFLLLDHFTDQRFYSDLDNDLTQAASGSNESDKDDFISGVSDEVTLSQTLKYVLPIGAENQDFPLSIYHLDEGLLQSGPLGGHEWNPMTSGRTTLASRFFYTYRDLSEYDEDEEKLVSKTNGLDIWLEYDNTDFSRNPTFGSRQQMKLSRDFGWLKSSNSWTNLELDFSKYYNLGTSPWFKHEALALNLWTSNTISWKDITGSQQARHRPPPNYGSELGGYDRMRGYNTARFRDKAASYYAAEIRLTPQFQKMRNWPIIKYFEVDWFQVVPFIEAGRVGPKYNSDLFTKDLKFDAGIGMRAMAYRTVFRLDFAGSDEGFNIQAMVSQPFSRPGN